MLGVLAMATLLWAAVDQFGVAPSDLFDLLIAVVVAALIIVAVAAIAAAIWVGLRKLGKH